MKMFALLLLVLLAAAAVAHFFRKRVFTVVVYQYEKGILFRRGHFFRVLDPGLYRFLRVRHKVEKVDMRLRTVSISGQEMLSQDNLSIKASLALQFSVADPVVAFVEVEQCQNALYLSAQLILRDLIAEIKAEDVMAKRRELSEALHKRLSERAKEYGLKMDTVELKDIAFPNEIKKIFTQAIKAQKEGLALLERARGETATLRHLANAAKTLEGNPALMQLRMLLTVGSGTGNSVVLGWPDGTAPLPLRAAGEAPAPQSPKGPAEE